MAGLEPLDPDGKPQAAYQLLASHGKDAIPKLFRGSDIKDDSTAYGVANRFIVHVRHAAALRESLISPSCSQALLQSHGIDETGFDALRAGDLQRFLIRRQERLVGIERDAVEKLGLEYSL